MWMEGGEKRERIREMGVREGERERRREVVGEDVDNEEVICYQLELGK